MGLIAGLYICVGALAVVLTSKYDRSVTEGDIWLGLGVLFLWPLLGLITFVVGGTVLLLKIGMRLR